MDRWFATLDGLYRSTLEEVYQRFEYKNSPRGHAEREIIGYAARIENPISRFCSIRRRRQNIIFNYAEALWYLSGRNDLAFIAYYAPSIARYSADGLTLPGTGYGARLLHFGPDGLNQIDRAFDILTRDDPDSKRVFLQIFDASEDLYRCNIDVSCTLGLQLLRRENKLHMVAFMRANDAYVGLLSDIFSFTFLQEYFASVLRCDVGSYSHHVGSIHIYDNHRENVAELLRHPASFAHSHDLPRMPAGCSAALIHRVLAYEARIRSGMLPFESLRHLDLDDYWLDILTLFWIHNALVVGKRIAWNVVSTLHPLHRDYLINRWGDSIELPERQELPT